MQTLPRLILASGSPRRRELLAQAGILFDVETFDVYETVGAELARDVEDHPDQVYRIPMELSRRKALAGAAAYENRWILGADTVVCYDGEILGKPADAAEALDMLCLLSGRVHTVITAVTLLRRQGKALQERAFYEETRVEMYETDRKLLQAYIQTGEPMDKAGAYGIQGRGAILVRRIEGDYNNVVGLPLARVYRELDALCREGAAIAGQSEYLEPGRPG